MTFETPDGRIVHVQSVDVDRNGKPTRRELDNAENIRRAGYRDKAGRKREVDIYLIPKGAQLERNQKWRLPRN